MTLPRMECSFITDFTAIPGMVVNTIAFCVFEQSINGENSK